MSYSLSTDWWLAISIKAGARLPCLCEQWPVPGDAYYCIQASMCRGIHRRTAPHSSRRRIIQVTRPRRSCARVRKRPSSVPKGRVARWGAVWLVRIWQAPGVVGGKTTTPRASRASKRGRANRWSTTIDNAPATTAAIWTVRYGSRAIPPNVSGAGIGMCQCRGLTSRGEHLKQAVDVRVGWTTLQTLT